MKIEFKGAQGRRNLRRIKREVIKATIEFDSDISQGDFDDFTDEDFLKAFQKRIQRAVFKVMTGKESPE